MCNVSNLIMTARYFLSDFQTIFEGLVPIYKCRIYSIKMSVAPTGSLLKLLILP